MEQVKGRKEASGDSGQWSVGSACSVDCSLAASEADKSLPSSNDHFLVCCPSSAGYWTLLGCNHLAAVRSAAVKRLELGVRRLCRRLCLRARSKDG